MEKLYITEEIAGHEANKHLNLEIGRELFKSFESACTEPMPPPPHQGAVGEYLCDKDKWVWVPAV